MSITSKFKIISLSKLAAEAKITKNRLFFNLNEVSNTLTYDEKRRMVNVVHREVNKFLNMLGYELPPPKEVKSKV